MGVAKNAAKDFAGEAEEVAGAALNKDDLEQDGHEKREEAQHAEKKQENRQGYEHTDQDDTSDGDMGMGNFNKDTTKSVDEVT